MQMLQKWQDRHKISFAIEFNNKNTKKVFEANDPPPPIQLSWIYPPIQLGLTDFMFPHFFECQICLEWWNEMQHYSTLPPFYSSLF